MKRILRFSLVLFLVLFVNVSCDHEMVFDEFYRIENGSWRWEDPAEFNFTVDDTASFNNILIMLRHSTDYPLSNLYMFVRISGPSGQKIVDTINFRLAEPDGKWLGTGVGNLREIGYLFRKNTRFPETGEYHVDIEQAMRLPEVPVRDVGFRIEHVKP